MPYNTLKEKVINRIPASRSDALLIADTQQSALIELFAAANSVRDFFRGGIIDLCAIINAKSGACPEDCSYCAQSSKTRADIPVYPLVNRNVVLEKAREARDKGVRRFCIVTSGRRVGQKELKDIASMIEGIRNTGLLPCATLGLLIRDEVTFLKDSGLERYHLNLETSERFFPE
ncbi:MAG: biotin synthase BioB, partial [Nitrospirae bacterium]|nr:biotin synthase BioB [Nitrospirota bacterium]